MTEIEIEGYGRFWVKVPDELVNKYKKAEKAYRKSNYDDELGEALYNVEEEIREYIYRHDNDIYTADTILIDE